ncbi:reverse transcriptase [Rhizobium leguminosarum]|nr:reverse transcriptase [Rhizobium leguminosarum]MBY5657320.1 reverse transcriptase [Rhizobium leguminosarum]
MCRRVSRPVLNSRGREVNRKHNGSLAPSRLWGKCVKPWTPTVRRYPHFDPVISVDEAAAIATNPTQVAEHTFYPFLKYNEGWTAFAKKGTFGRRKDRPIRYAARLDSCIYSYYRYLLSEPYEQKLLAEGLTNSVIAYRRILKSNGRGGQSNVEFALSAVDAIRSLGNCCTLALDISSFFESLDHVRLREVWGDLLGVSRLPEDHFRVYQAITKYAYVELEEAYERLGFYGEKKDGHGKTRPGFLRSLKEMPIQLCDGRSFRAKIASDGGLPSIIKTNKEGMGVPQGAPLSDLLANAYLLEFDKFVRDLCAKVGGTYFRYSDDILIVAPISVEKALDMEEHVRAAISALGKGLVIKEAKSAIHRFEGGNGRQNISVIKAFDKDDKPMPSKPFEYLGFRYDGCSVFIRDKTMSNLHRKIASVCRASAIKMVKRYQGKAADEILEMADLERLIQAFGPVEDFRSKASDYRAWTFTTYAKRASRAMGTLGKPIARQLGGLRRSIKTRLAAELQRALS